ncbi:hypothetical protein HYT33_03630 [Candidatus Roizmanbacteria bacterium]|nr:hypothetical protein [Candidatus Roizmanbacteria bacterium]
MNKYLIAGLSVFLILLVVATVFISNLLRRREEEGKTTVTTPIPTVSFESRGVPSPRGASRETNLSPQEKQRLLDEARRFSKVFTQDQLDSTKKFNVKLPYESADFDIAYSDLTGQYFVKKKTPQADAKLDEFLRQNNMSAVRDNFNYLFVFGDEPVSEQRNKAEDKARKAREEPKEESRVPVPSPPSVAPQKKDIELLVKLVKSLTNLGSGAGQAGQGGAGLIPNAGVLDGIFNEAGQKAGTPPVILRAVMRIECGSILSLPPETIVEYSTAGNGIPPGHPCFRNSAGAMGPMQFMSGTWPGYGSAVNRIGGYPHEPYVENIRDSVYASAEKLKSDSQAPDFNWSQEQVRRAIVCYHAGCARYPNNIPQSTQRYFDQVWQEYTGS